MDNIAQVLGKRAQLNPDTEAFVEPHRGLRLTFREHNRRANQSATALRDLGVGKGDRVAILMMNSAEYMEVFYGLARLGAICVPLNWRLTLAELNYILGHSGSTYLVFGSEFADTATAIKHHETPDSRVTTFMYCGEADWPGDWAGDILALRSRAPDIEFEVAAGDKDPLFIMYTSGTTGLPKGVVHTHQTFMWALITQAATEEIRCEDRFITSLPMYHVGALAPVIFGAYLGFTIISIKEFDPVTYWRLIDDEKVTVTLLVAAMISALLQVPENHRHDYSSMRWAMVGAAPVPPVMITTLENMGIAVHQVYGLTETCGPACMIMGEEAKRRTGSAGKGFFHTDVRVVDGDDRDVSPGDSGEVIVRAPHNMKEYWNDPAATAEADDDGFIYIIDRIKDMIISGGENIYPAEVESVIVSLPGVVDVGVVGRADDRWGEVPVAFVIREGEQTTADDILDGLGGRLAKYKMPKEIRFVETLPRNPSGKILKRELRKLL